MKKSLSILLALAMVIALVPAFAVAEGAAYTEAPMLAALVESGELPAVEERLPANPNVLDVPEVGAYGGVWRQAVTTGTFNHAQHHLTGYLSSNALIYARDNATITTGWLESFAYNDEMTEFTFTLREGLKWSNGAPVTTADVAFWYNDVIKNEELTPSESYYQDCTFTAADDTTWTLVFEAPKPLYTAYWAYNENSRFVYPSEYLKQFHAAYLTADELAAVLDAEGFDDWTTMFEDKYNDQKNMELPVLGPWIMTVDPATTNTITYERNPYYWAVDQAGQQLPYIDNAIISIVESTDLVNMKVIAGEVDVQVASVQESFSNYPLFA
ncbi:MAG: ABC transporter substrate-binding protein, partial [Christensenellales bacterium]